MTIKKDSSNKLGSVLKPGLQSQLWVYQNEKCLLRVEMCIRSLPGMYWTINQSNPGQKAEKHVNSWSRATMSIQCMSIRNKRMNKSLHKDVLQSSCTGVAVDGWTLCVWRKNSSSTWFRIEARRCLHQWWTERITFCFTSISESLTPTGRHSSFNQLQFELCFKSINRER